MTKKQIRLSELHTLSDSLLEKFELTDQGQVLLVDYCGKKYVGEYEWRQGRNPHGFAIGDDWIQTGEVEYVAFFMEE